jgi:MSHA biogenesis protein MshQ
MWPKLQSGWALVLGLVLAFAGGGARADTAITLFQSFAGNVNFVGTQKTMRTKTNPQDPCAVLSATAELTATLSGIPAGATVLSAQLYWAASNSSPDYKITFDGMTLEAPRSRQYFSRTIGSGFDYFGGAVDVTAQVRQKRNGDYKFYGLNVNKGKPYCASEGVIGGFSLLVIFSHPGETFRVLNLYEGFQFIRYNGVTLNLGNFLIPSPIGTATGRLGHVTWEGDSTLGKNGEDLLFNGHEMTDSLNPVQNQFNSRSNINNDPASHGIDFDAYTVAEPVIKAGQTSARTRYQSGQDLVLLNAEIIAVPNVSTADLGIVMTRHSQLIPLKNAVYTLTVSNGGPNAETGPITVTDTLPSGLSLVSASGAGWTCGSAGKVVTCSHPGPLDVSASLPPITLTVAVAASGSMTNTASVAGKLFDNISANNTASDNGAGAGAGTGAGALLSYAFTDGPCIPNLAFGNANQCKEFEWGPVTANAPIKKLYVTALSAGIPTQLSASVATKVPVYFALSCHSPEQTAGVKATFSGLVLPACTAKGAAPSAWSNPLDLDFAVNKPSAQLENIFQYNDVGRIQLYMRDQNSRLGAGLPFVSRPASLAFTEIKRTSDGFPNPAAATGAGPGFLKAGEAFTMTVAALTSTGDVAPNFGNEGARITLMQEGKATRVTPRLDGAFDEPKDGRATGTAFSWDEVGILVLTPMLSTKDYLATGDVNRIAATVGRFYPDHFETTAPNPPMLCMPKMNCPAVNGAAYSGQPFTVTVSAHSAKHTDLKNYTGEYARDVKLGAYDQAGGTIANPPGKPGGTMAANIIKAAAFVAAVEPDAPALLVAATPSYTLPVPFLNTAPHALNWTGPTTIYVRASSEENLSDGGTATVTSLLPKDSVEGGITIVNGRLRLSNAYGSELLKLPVRMEAQYWTAATPDLAAFWENNSKDSVSTVIPGEVSFSKCLKTLKTSDTPPACKAAPVLEAMPGAALTLKDGVNTFWLKASGRGNLGSADIQMKPMNPTWLPSTVARVVFGIYKSPLIYTREIY